MPYNISGPGPLPPTFVSEKVASTVLEGPVTPQVFLERTSAAPPESLDDVCGVCLETLRKDGAIRNTECMHVFHRQCTELLLLDYSKCPMCRTDWLCSRDDHHAATDVLTALDSLQMDGVHMVPFELDANLGEEFDQILHNTLCKVAFCMQVQNIASKDWTREDRETRRRLQDPMLRAEALDNEVMMRIISKSRDGHLAVECLLKCIKKVTPQELEDCFIYEGFDELADDSVFDSEEVSHHLAPLLHRLLVETAADMMSATPGRELSPEIGLFVMKLATVTLASAVCLGDPLAIPANDFAIERETMDVFDEAQDDEHVLALLGV